MIFYESLSAVNIAASARMHATVARGLRSCRYKVLSNLYNRS